MAKLIKKVSGVTNTITTQNQYSLDLELDSSQYAKITDASQTGLGVTGDFSIEAWIKLETLPGATTTVIAGKYNTTGSQRSYIFRFVNSSALDVVFFSDATNFTRATCSTAFTSADVGVWVHVACTVDVSAGYAGINIYKNGIAQSTTNESDLATSVATSTADFRIGADHQGNNLDGMIDEVRFWNDKRTQSEIATNMYQNVASDASGLVSYWQFENDYLDKTANNNDLTAVGSPVFASTADSVPFTYYYSTTDNLTSVDFEADSSQYTSIADASQTGLDLTSTFTIECWYRPESFPAVGSLVTKYNYGAANDRSYDFYCESTGKLGVELSDDGSGNATHWISSTSAVTLVAGNWYHVAVTGNVGTEVFKFYVNGVEETGTNSAGDSIGATLHNSDANFAIGAKYNNGTAANFIDGLIDEVKVFNDVRTVTEIKSDMYTKNVTDANLVGEWNLDGDYLDATANNNDLTSSGSPPFYPQSSYDIYNRRAVYLVTDDAISIVNHADLRPTIYTIGAWVKTTGAGEMAIIESHSYDGVNQGGILLYVSSSSHSGNIIQYDTAGAGDCGFALGTTAVNDGLWHWVVGTYDGTHIKSYIDGVLEGTDGSAPTNPAYLAGNTVRIGCSRNSVPADIAFLTGQIDGAFLVNGTAWDATKIASYKYKQIDPAETNLKLLSNLNGNFLDTSGNAHHGSAISVPSFLHITPFDGSSLISAVSTVPMTSSVNKVSSVQN